jgi:inorganic pyrophosphatase
LTKAVSDGPKGKNNKQNINPRNEIKKNEKRKKERKKRLYERYYQKTPMESGGVSESLRDVSLCFR